MKRITITVWVPDVEGTFELVTAANMITEVGVLVATGLLAGELSLIARGGSARWATDEVAG